MNAFQSQPLPKMLASITLGAALAAVALFFLLPSHKIPTLNAKDIALRAIQADTMGIDASTPFVLTSKTPINVDDVKQLIQVNPATTLTFKQNSKTEIQFAASTPLKPNKVYQFTLPAQDQKLSWAFQVKGEFGVTGILPDNKQTNVPLDTGIEITFTHENFMNYEQFVSIAPHVDGRFEKHKKVLVFVPKKLEPKTLYTVTVKKGMPLEGSPITLDQDKIFQFETSGPESQYHQSFEVVQNEIEFDTAHDQLMGLYGNVKDGTNIDVTAYKFQSQQAYIDSYIKLLTTNYWSTFNKYQFDQLQKIVSPLKTMSIAAKGDNQSNTYLVLPEKLPVGLYLLALKNADFPDPRYVWVQVTNVGSFLELNQKNAIIWSHNLLTGKPLNGAKVVFGDGSATNTSGTTDAQGSLVMPLPENYYQKDSKPTSLTISANKESLIMFVQNFTNNKRAASDYWSFISNDRPVYKQTDSISFFGFVKAKTGSNPGSITATLTSSSYYELDSTTSAPLFTSDIPLTNNGTFTGNWNLKNIPQGYYMINIKDGDLTISQQYIEVQNYVKPAYAIDIDAPQGNILAGESMKLTVHAHFFDGTPVPNKRITMTLSGYEDDTKTLTTDAQGKATMTFSPKIDMNENSGTSRWESIQATPETNEEGEISTNLMLTVFRTNIILDTNSTTNSTAETMQITAYHVDVSKQDGHGAIVPNYTFNVQPEEITYEKVKVSDYYDFINKKVVPWYQYNQIMKPGATTTLTTDAQGKANFVWTFKKDVSGRLNITGKDSRQAPFSLQPPLGYFYGFGDSGTDSNLTTSINKSEPYKTNEDIQILVSKHGAAADNDNYLYLKSNWKETKAYPSNSATFNAKFLAEDAPGASFEVFHFTGSIYEFIGGHSAKYDAESEKKMDIQITSDKDRYGPGESAQLTIRTTHDGSPVSADVNLNLIDEAYYRLYWSESDPLAEIYSPSFGGNNFWYFSHTPKRWGGGAEKGGGGGDSVRANFKDKALYQTVTTDGSGNATVTFKLPDNITSWRVTAQGVNSKSVYAGVSTKQIPVGLPFFVDAIVAQEFLVADKPILEVATYGEQISPSNNVTITYSIPGLMDGSKTVSAKGLDRVNIPLPPLKTGTYKITITGETNGLKDAITREFSVITSRLNTLSQVAIPLANFKGTPAEVASSKSHVKITVQETEKAIAYQALWGFIDTSGARFDQRAAHEKSTQILKNFFKDEVPESDSDVSLAELYQANSGGIKLLPYSSDDLELSAKAAILGIAESGNISKENLRNYFVSIITQEQSKKFPLATRERYTMAVSGLAALHEPVLLTLQQLAKQTDLSAMEKLYIAAGSMAIGDQGTAEYFAKDLLLNNSEKINNYIRIFAGKDKKDLDEIVAHTALMSVIAAELNLPEYQSLVAYLHDQPGRDLLTSLEQVTNIEKRMAFIKQEDASFTYTSNGSSKNITLKNGDGLYLKLSPEMAAGLNFSNAKGDLTATYTYDHLSDKSQLSKNTSIGITRTYKLHGKAVTSWSTNDIISVELTPKLGAYSLDGCYTATEYLPSGLKALTWNVRVAGENQMNTSRPYMSDGQAQHFCTSKRYEGGATIRFPARVVNKGTFVAEPATIQMTDKPDIINASNESSITIR